MHFVQNAKECSLKTNTPHNLSPMNTVCNYSQTVIVLEKRNPSLNKIICNFSLQLLVYCDKMILRSKRQIPQHLEIDMDNDTIIQTGFYHGQNLVIYNYKDVKITEDMNYEDFLNKLYDLVWQADESYRSYSPFEFFAHDLNEMEDPDAAWEMYEQAIADGIDDEINTTIEELRFEEIKAEMFNE